MCCDVFCELEPCRCDISVPGLIRDGVSRAGVGPWGRVGPVGPGVKVNFELDCSDGHLNSVQSAEYCPQHSCIMMSPIGARQEAIREAERLKR